MGKNKKTPSVVNKNKKTLESNQETSIIKSINSKLIKSILAIVIILFTIILSSCIIDIFDFFYKLHPHAGYTSLGLIILLLLIFVVRPIVVMLTSPCFTLDVSQHSSKEISKRNYRSLKKVAKNLLNSDYLSSNSKELIKTKYHDKQQLNLALKDIYDKEISKKINQVINETSSKVLVATAISQSNKFDALTVILLNVRMIMRIVVLCGYRPSYTQLAKLMLKVFRNALIAYSIQTIEIDEMIFNGINRLVKGALNSLPFVSELTKSLTQGGANALLTLRIGIITRKYLYEEFDIQKMIANPEECNNSILMDAVTEANSSIDIIVDSMKQKKEKQVA